MKRIISIGEIVWDVLPTGWRLGGAPINFAYYSNALGAESFPISAVGRDADGDELLGSLVETGLDVRGIQRNDLPTSRVLVHLDKGGIPQYEIVEGVAWDGLVLRPEDVELMSRADAVCWGSLAQRNPVSRKCILQLVDASPSDSIKVFDINIRQSYYDKETVTQSLERCNILKLNEDELPLLKALLYLPQDDASAIEALCRTYFIDTVIFTQGAACSEVYSADGLLSHVKTPSVRVEDTVGAGDSFTAAYVAKRLSGASVVTAHRKAVEVSAWVCTCKGAINPMPTHLL